MFRVSLRELFALVTCCALALVSLKYASEAWLAFALGVAMLAFFAAIVLAAIDRGPRQAFGVAFILIVIAYGFLVFETPRYPGNAGIGTGEFNLWQGHLPTTYLLRFVYTAVEDRRWFDSTTGKEINNFDPANPSIPIDNSVGDFGGGGGGFSGGGGVAPSTASLRVFPSQQHFALIGHLWWALLFGYIGGRFARYVYARRIKDQPPLAMTAA
jgi:hypothetical protein